MLIPAGFMHLHVLIHGVQGHPRHLAEAAHLFAASHAAVHLLVPTSFAYQNTYDGIDSNAHRVLHELDDAVVALEKDPAVRVTEFSISGYSLGGLIARYVVGILYSRGFFDSVAAVNFASFTTPHVGIPPYPHTARILFWLGSTMLGRTGEQLHLIDSWADTGRPLLQVMANVESPFYHGLAKFRNISIYANAINDFTVPYFSGAFEDTDPFAGHPERDIIPEYLPDYAPLIQGFSIVSASPSLIARLKSLRPLTFSGPFIAWVFPWNLILYLVLPLFVPLGILYLAIDYLISSRASRARIRLLQPSVAIIIHPAPDSDADAPTLDSTIMTAAQVRMVRALNKLDRVRKHTAFRPAVRNAHAMLICLEPRFADHRVGRGVLRHWVDHFEVVRL
ncbi:putative serine esterase-domain-containing protein [Mycena rosella]|uniref:Serine esterase-domain-containing protein n=1 Tax=Mycena rosella TaxID=1033263 RepID=A0AAD7CXP3_MYCRO|nr:putative serine esterase-domain-containing protein [Mycena rosella]